MRILFVPVFAAALLGASASNAGDGVGVDAGVHVGNTSAGVGAEVDRHGAGTGAHVGNVGVGVGVHGSGWHHRRCTRWGYHHHVRYCRHWHHW